MSRLAMGGEVAQDMKSRASSPPKASTAASTRCAGWWRLARCTPRTSASAPLPYYYHISISMRVQSCTVKSWGRVRLAGEGRGLGREIGEGSGGEVVEDGVLAFRPGVV